MLPIEYILWTLSLTISTASLIYMMLVTIIMFARMNVDKPEKEDELEMLNDYKMQEMHKLHMASKHWIFKPTNWLLRAILRKTPKWTDTLDPPTDSRKPRK